MAIRSFLIFFITFLPLFAQGPTIRIASISDGDSPFLSHQRQVIEHEVEALLVPEYTPEFPADLAFVADWSVDTIEKDLHTVMERPDVDFIITVGLLSSTVASLTPLNKPVVGSILLENLIPGVTPETEGSGIPNFTYIGKETDVKRDLKALADLVPYHKLAIVVDAQLYHELPAIQKEIAAVQKEMGIQVVTVRSGQSAAHVIEQIPPDVDAVYLTPLYRMPHHEFVKLTARFKEMRLPSFSLFGEQDVKRGVLAGLTPSSNAQQIGRRVAINVQRVLMGENISSIPTDIKGQTRLYYNVETGHALDLTPQWMVLADAVLYGDRGRGTKIDMAWALDRTLCVNPTIKAAEEVVREQRGELCIARSKLLPRIQSELAARQIDRRSAEASFGFDPERLIQGRISGSQVIYSPRRFANVRSERALVCSSIADRRDTKIDILFQAGVAYVELLLNQSLLAIEELNLELTRKNLLFSEIRKEIGVARANEVYRWESQLSTNKDSVVRSYTNVQNTEALLNQLLARPSLCYLDPIETDLHGLMQTIGGKGVAKFLGDQADVNKFTQFQICEAMRCSPILESLYYQIRAQYQQVRADKQEFILPDIEFRAETAQQLVRGGAGLSPPDFPEFEEILGRSPPLNTWVAGVFVQFPLFLGGERWCRLKKDQARLRELSDLWQREADIVSRDVTTSVNRILASYIGIGLSHAAVEAAQKNLDFVVSAYAKGAVGYLNVLDAQNIYIEAKRSVVNSEYNFAIDLLRMMRAVGKFDYFLSDCHKEEWMHSLEAYFEAN